MPEIEILPGIANTRAKKLHTVSWREANLMRWEGVTLKPVGGWEKINYTPFASRLRAVHRWDTNDGKSIIAYLCEEHCYVDKGDDVLTDITPVGGITPPAHTDAGGYGSGLYSAGTYGSPRDAIDRKIVPVPIFTLDNWGEELRAMTSADGRLLRWDPNTPGMLLEAVENAPVANRTFVVTPERFIVLFGADGDLSRWEWCDQEDDTNWTPAIDSKAGGFNVDPRASILSAHRVSYGILMFTSKLQFIITYIGLPYIFAYTPITECPAPYAPPALIETPEGATWLANNGFWVYNGVSASPIECSIWDWVNDQIHFGFSRFEAAALFIPSKFEVWFCFVADDDTGFENNRLAIYNYKTHIWSMGKLSRNCGYADPTDQGAIMSDGSDVFRHESGFSYVGAPELPWIESFTLNINNGVNMSTIFQMLPEFDGEANSIQYKFYKSINPSDASQETVSSPKVIRSNGYVDIRETARDFRMRIETIVANDWSHGPIQLDVKARGKK